MGDSVSELDCGNGGCGGFGRYKSCSVVSAKGFAGQFGSGLISKYIQYPPFHVKTNPTRLIFSNDGDKCNPLLTLRFF